MVSFFLSYIYIFFYSIHFLYVLYNRTIGMFEQNNVGVQMKTPLAEYVEGLISGAVTADAPTLAFIADAATQIVQH